jgi:hypothetical protein
MGGEAVPHPLLLVLVQAALLAVVHQHMQHDVFGHAAGEIGLVHAPLRITITSLASARTTRRSWLMNR